MDKNKKIGKIFLAAGAIGWGIAILGVLLPWNVITPMLQSMGASTDFTDAQLRYWLRMACGGWSIIGFLFLMVLLKPSKYSKYGNIVPLLAAGSIFEGIVLLLHGLLLGVPLFPFAGDVLFCLVVGIGLLWTGRSLGETDRTHDDEASMRPNSSSSENP